jgi:glycosyltransferase involved in cell wall biosynthesis
VWLEAKRLDVRLWYVYPRGRLDRRTPAAATVLPAPGQAPAPSVCLLHNYRERQQMSMKLYAEQLGDALERAGAAVEHVRLSDLLQPHWRRFPFLDKVDSYFGRFAVYPRLARGLRADVFHIVDHGQAFLLKSLDPARTVVTCHDLILLVLASGRLGSKIRPTLATHVLRYAVGHLKRARWLIAVSEQTREDMASLLGIDPSKVDVIYPGLNDCYRPMPDSRAHTRGLFGIGDGPVALHVGASLFYKNIEGCLRVVAQLRKAGLPVTFVRAGQKLQPSQIRLVRTLGLDHAVRDLGPLSNDDLASLYNAADVLLFPSLYEGFGWPPLEAMASGTPVVCSRVGALREVVGDAALTAEPEDVSSLASHVATVLADPTVGATLRRRGLERAKMFNWDRSAGEVLRTYQRIIHG